MQQLTILGSTGSIGVSTLDVVARHPDRFKIFALTAHTRIDDLASQCRLFKPRYAVVTSKQSAQSLAGQVPAETKVLFGSEGFTRAAEAEQVDIVVAGIVGAVGLSPTLAAVNAGKKILLANKEALVMAGGLFIEAVRRSGATLLPIDSEHNAIFQCLPADYARDSAAGRQPVGNSQNGIPRFGIKRLLLAGSGGPFRTIALDKLASVTPDQACAHPNWKMGRKISVDSATMMNKGLELIEACWLFNTSEQKIDIIIHPESIVHSLVEYTDGSVLAELGNPDMRTPIAQALAWPERMESGVAVLDLVAAGTLNFEPPDVVRFPCLEIARAAAREMGDAPAALNAANEMAVEAFLKGNILFTDIFRVVDGVMQKWSTSEPERLEVVQEADRQARELAVQVIAGL